MPLSPSDIQYLNTLLDKRLKFNRSWPRMRYFVMAMAVSFIAVGLWSFTLVSPMLDDMDFKPPATRKAIENSTRPATFGELQNLSDHIEFQSQLEAKMASTLAMSTEMAMIMVMVSIFVGSQLASVVLVKWNCHRRDAVLIALLREKCATELGMPTDAPPRI